jgi:trans-aconitate methyltransferase
MAFSQAHAENEGGVSPPDIDARHYRQNSSVQYALAEDLLVCHDFRTDERILDMGCGDGRISVELAKRVPEGHVTGVDPSETMLRLAQDQPLENLNFVQGSAEDFQASEGFDLITAFSCLHWVRAADQGIRNLSEQLLPGGRMLCLTFPKESPYYRVLEAVIYSQRWSRYAEGAACDFWLTSEDYAALVQDLGLEPLLFQTDQALAEYKDQQDYRDYVRGWLPCLVGIPEDLQEDFLNDLSAHAHALYAEDGQEKFSIPYAKIALYLEKPTSAFQP